MVFIKRRYCTCPDHGVKNMRSVACAEVEVMVAVGLDIVVVVMMAVSQDRGKSRGAEKAGAVETGGSTASSAGMYTALQMLDMDKLQVDEVHM
jgi:hypothetical protein